jgi:hypothetical protein
MVKDFKKSWEVSEVSLTEDMAFGKKKGKKKSNKENGGLRTDRCGLGFHWPWQRTTWPY